MNTTTKQDNAARDAGQLDSKEREWNSIIGGNFCEDHALTWEDIKSEGKKLEYNERIAAAADSLSSFVLSPPSHQGAIAALWCGAYNSDGSVSKNSFMRRMLTENSDWAWIDIQREISVYHKQLARLKHLSDLAACQPCKVDMAKAEKYRWALSSIERLNADHSDNLEQLAEEVDDFFESLSDCKVREFRDTECVEPFLHFCWGVNGDCYGVCPS